MTINPSFGPINDALARLRQLDNQETSSPEFTESPSGAAERPIETGDQVEDCVAACFADLENRFTQLTNEVGAGASDLSTLRARFTELEATEQKIISALRASPLARSHDLSERHQTYRRHADETDAHLREAEISAFVARAVEQLPSEFLEAEGVTKSFAALEACLNKIDDARVNPESRSRAFTQVKAAEERLLQSLQGTPLAESAEIQQLHTRFDLHAASFTIRLEASRLSLSAGTEGVEEKALTCFQNLESALADLSNTNILSVDEAANELGRLNTTEKRLISAVETSTEATPSAIIRAHDAFERGIHGLAESIRSTHLTRLSGEVTRLRKELLTAAPPSMERLQAWSRATDELISNTIGTDTVSTDERLNTIIEETMATLKQLRTSVATHGSSDTAPNTVVSKAHLEQLEGRLGLTINRARVRLLAKRVISGGEATTTPRTIIDCLSALEDWLGGCAQPGLSVENRTAIILEAVATINHLATAYASSPEGNSHQIDAALASIQEAVLELERGIVPRCLEKEIPLLTPEELSNALAVHWGESHSGYSPVMAFFDASRGTDQLCIAEPQFHPTQLLADALHSFVQEHPEAFNAGSGAIQELATDLSLSMTTIEEADQLLTGLIALNSPDEADVRPSTLELSEEERAKLLAGADGASTSGPGAGHRQEDLAKERRDFLVALREHAFSLTTIPLELTFGENGPEVALQARTGTKVNVSASNIDPRAPIGETPRSASFLGTTGSWNTTLRGRIERAYAPLRAMDTLQAKGYHAVANSEEAAKRIRNKAADQCIRMAWFDPETLSLHVSVSPPHTKKPLELNLTSRAQDGKQGIHAAVTGAVEALEGGTPEVLSAVQKLRPPTPDTDTTPFDKRLDPSAPESWTSYILAVDKAFTEQVVLELVDTEKETIPPSLHSEAVALHGRLSRPSSPDPEANEMRAATARELTTKLVMGDPRYAVLTDNHETAEDRIEAAARLIKLYHGSMDSDIVSDLLLPATTEAIISEITGDLAAFATKPSLETVTRKLIAPLAGENTEATDRLEADVLAQLPAAIHASPFPLLALDDAITVLRAVRGGVPPSAQQLDALVRPFLEDERSGTDGLPLFKTLPTADGLVSAATVLKRIDHLDNGLSGEIQWAAVENLSALTSAASLSPEETFLFSLAREYMGPTRTTSHEKGLKLLTTYISEHPLTPETMRTVGQALAVAYALDEDALAPLAKSIAEALATHEASALAAIDSASDLNEKAQLLSEALAVFQEIPSEVRGAMLRSVRREHKFFESLDMRVAKELHPEDKRLLYLDILEPQGSFTLAADHIEAAAGLLPAYPTPSRNASDTAQGLKHSVNELLSSAEFLDEMENALASGKSSEIHTLDELTNGIAKLLDFAAGKSPLFERDSRLQSDRRFMDTLHTFLAFCTDKLADDEGDLERRVKAVLILAEGGYHCAGGNINSAIEAFNVLSLSDSPAPDVLFHLALEQVRLDTVDAIVLNTLRDHALTDQVHSRHNFLKALQTDPHAWRLNPKTNQRRDTGIRLTSVLRRYTDHFEASGYGYTPDEADELFREAYSTSLAINHIRKHQMSTVGRVLLENEPERIGDGDYLAEAFEGNGRRPKREYVMEALLESGIAAVGGRKMSRPGSPTTSESSGAETSGSLGGSTDSLSGPDTPPVTDPADYSSDDDYSIL